MKSFVSDPSEHNSFFENDNPHGVVKRHIFRRHCEAFVAKTQNCKLQTIIYDAFAGAGYYVGLPNVKNSYGSPLICLDVVIKYFQQKSTSTLVYSPFTQEVQDIKPIVKDIQMPESEDRVVLNFSEANRDNCLKLVNNIVLFLRTSIGDAFFISLNNDGVMTISSYNEEYPFCINIANAEFIQVRPPDDKPYRRLLTFIDPFGYSQIPMKHVQRFIGERREAFINFMSSYVNRFKNVKSNETAIIELYGFSDEERNECLQNLQVMSDHDEDGINRCVQMYETKLKKQAESTYILGFTVRNKKNVRLYHLIFITNHIKGFKAMKEAMKSGSQDADSLSVSDYHVEKNGMQLSLVNKQDIRVVAAKIYERFQGQNNVNIKVIENFIWFKTPYVWRKKPLKILQKEPEDHPRLTNVKDKDGKKPSKKYTYPGVTEWLLTFRPKSDAELSKNLHKLKLE
ncbi:hypothetical protein ACJMK2_010301 [Sinanodonta woodiana]|uniref:Three-Cys-motif partner protein TcmP n=1 Tax=Sinanodonta woodiana TaxID=1069815 RepID=A0ABD3VEW7_SINWO